MTFGRFALTVALAVAPAAAPVEAAEKAAWADAAVADAEFAASAVGAVRGVGPTTTGPAAGAVQGGAAVYAVRRAPAASEAVVAALTRETLRQPASIEAWVGLARSLRALRPEAWRDVPTSAERLAMHVADSLARATPGALTELRLEPGAGRTEIAVEVTGEARYRLFRRLSDTVDPRLTLEVIDAVPGLLEPRYAGLDRGGVRELRVTPTDSGTVQVAISLSEPRAFGVEEREGEVVVWVRSDEASFVPWRSRPTWARGEPEVFHAAPVPATRQPEMPTSIDEGADRAGADRVDPDPSRRAGAGDEPGVAVRMDGEPMDGTWTSDGASDADGLRAGPAAFAAGESLERMATRVRATARRIDAGVAAPLALALAIAWTALAWRAASSRRAAAGAGSTRRLPRRAAGARSTDAAGEVGAMNAVFTSGATGARDARLWTVRTLAERGASEAEIARSTGLSQDAVMLIVRSLGERSVSESSAVSGSFFRHRRRGRDVAMAGAR